MDFIELISKVAEVLDRPDLVQCACISKGTNNATIKTLRNIKYYLFGTSYTKVATDNIAMTSCSEQPIDTYCFYLFSIDRNGQVLTTKGAHTSTDTCTPPSTPTGYKAIGAIKIQTVSTTFTAGTDDLSKTGINVTYYDIDCGAVADFIRQAIYKLERRYNFRHMKVRTTVNLPADSYYVFNPIPNYKNFISIYCIDSDGNRTSIEKTSINKAMNLYPIDTDKGKPQYIVDIASLESSLTPDISPTHQLIFRPTADKAYTIEMYAYQYSPTLDGMRYTTNWWTENAWDVALYGALVEAEPYLISDARVPLWKALFEEKVKDLIDAEVEEEFKGSFQELTSDYVI